MLKTLTITLPLVVILSAMCLGTAQADPFVENMGLRIGGYGFREPTSPTGETGSATGWQACRMNGVGVFANKTISEGFFIEAGFDTYFADSFVVKEARATYDTPIDRKSALLTVAVGSRFYQEARLSPYLQAGLGAEATHVSLPVLGLEDTALLPFGFFGVGADIRVSATAKVGASLRINAMGYYDDAQFQTELGPELGLSTQTQFYASFAL